MEKPAMSISDSRIKRVWEILGGKAKVILDKWGPTGLGSFGRMCLIEFTDGSHYPFPKLSRILQFFARRLNVEGIRGVDWWFTCPSCGERSYYTLRNRQCDMCNARFNKHMQVTNPGSVLEEHEVMDKRYSEEYQILEEFELTE